MLRQAFNNKSRGLPAEIGNLWIARLEVIFKIVIHLELKLRLEMTIAIVHLMNDPIKVERVELIGFLKGGDLEESMTLRSKSYIYLFQLFANEVESLENGFRRPCDGDDPFGAGSIRNVDAGTRLKSAKIS